MTYDCHQAATESNVATLFFVVKVADDGTPNGTAYVVYSDGQDIYLRHSTDKGVTWSQRVRVKHHLHAGPGVGLRNSVACEGSCAWAAVPATSPIPDTRETPRIKLPTLLLR